MEFYHISRKNSVFQPGDTLTLGEDGLSSWGRTVLLADSDIAMDDYESLILEYYLETVRSMFFPDLPSRLRSLFACFREDIPLWIRKLEREGEPIQIYRVEARDYEWFDASVLNILGVADTADRKAVIGGETYLKAAHSYWSNTSPLPRASAAASSCSAPCHGDRQATCCSRSPEREFLLQFPVKILGRIAP